MEITWIVENFTKEQSYIDLLDAAKAAGHKTIDIKGGYDSSILKSLKTERNCVVFNGSIEMAKIVKKELSNCYPVIYSDFNKFKCSEYYSYFGNKLFNDKYAIISLSELSRQRFLYYGMFGKDALIFIRPDSGEKTFQAQLLDIIDLDRFVAKNEDIKHGLVVVSTPKSIRGEWRVVCSKEGVIDYSLYNYQGQISKIRSIPNEALDFVKEILNVGYFPDDVFCVDICSDFDNNYWMLELTSFSSCGLYACDKPNIVKSVSEIALENFK